MIKQLIAPVIALFVVLTGITTIAINYDSWAKPSEADQAYFIKDVSDANVVVVEPNYGKFYNPDPNVQGDPSGEILYSSLDGLAHSYDIKQTQMVRFERKGQMIPNLYVFVESPDGALQIADGISGEQEIIAENIAP